MDIEIKQLSGKDVSLFGELILLFKNVFESGDVSAPKASYLENLLLRPGFIALIIMYKNELAGGVTAFELPMYYGEYTEVYIYDIAIKHDFQRKGFGKQLLIALRQYCHEHGVREFFVEAHEEDDFAVNFYYSAGGKAEKVVHFNFKV